MANDPTPRATTTASRAALLRTALVLASLLGPRGLAAQCEPEWAAGTGLSGVDDMVFAQHLWDPDGPGPLPAQLVLGGMFDVAGGLVSPRLARLDPTTNDFATFPNTAFDGFDIRAIETLPNGDLVVAGTFDTTGAVAAANVARFDGQNWHAMGSGLGTANDPSSRVQSLAVLPNGDLVAAGQFSLPGSAAPCTLARWDGAQWSVLAELSGALASTQVHDLLVTQAGDLLVAGWFTTIGGIPASNVARYDGTQWSTFGSGANGRVTSIAEAQNGDLIFGGAFTSFDGVACGLIVRGNGTSWFSQFPPPPPIGALYPILGLQPLPGGGLVATGGPWTMNGRAIGVLQGGTWQFVGTGLRQASGLGGTGFSLLQLPNGKISVAGNFDTVDGKAAANIALLDPNTTAATGLGGGTNGRIEKLLRTRDGTVHAAGLFVELAGHPAAYVARRLPNGAWQPIDATAEPNAPVVDLAELPNGDLVVAGDFTSIGNQPFGRIARWDGTAWQPLGAGSATAVTDVAIDRNGDLLAWGTFWPGEPASGGRWDGSAWQRFGFRQPLTNTTLRMLEAGPAMAVEPAGTHLYQARVQALGGPNLVESRLVRWDGQSWSLVTTALPLTTRVVLVLSDGSILSDRHHWNGSSWQPLQLPPNLTAIASAPRPDGVDWLACFGDGESAVFAGRIGAWQLAGSELVRRLETLLPEPDGSLLVGGNHFTTGGAAYLTRLVPTCAADTTRFGSGCAGGSGTVVELDGRVGAWLGGAASADATGMLPGSLCVPTLGLQPQNLPLGSLLPGAYPGCSLLHGADLLLSPLPAPSGTATVTLPIPPLPALVGQTLHAQVVSLELPGAAASNGLTWRIGSY